MKRIVALLQKRGILFSTLTPIDPKLLKTRKKIEIYEGVDLGGYYVAIFAITQKSRFLRKNAEEIEELYRRLIALREHNFKKKILIYEMPLCSKAMAQMREAKWILIDAAA